jgi:elongation factor G
MTRHQVQDIRNVALCGHGGAGKTTLVDQLLIKTGAVKGNHSVVDGTSICDFDPEEKQHKHSIEASVVFFEYAGKRFNVIDTPGYPDFLGQTIGALAAVETAVIVINAHSGIQVNTRRVYAEAEKLGLARVIVLNKMDEHNVDFARLVEEIHELWGAECVPLNVPLGQEENFKGVASTLHPPATFTGAVMNPAELHDQLIETIVQVDDAALERYFEGEMPEPDRLNDLMCKALSQGALVPIVCCSAKTGAGLAELLDTLAACSLSPAAAPPRKVTKEGEEREITADPNGPLVAQVFKTRIDPFVQKLSFIRIFSGHLKKDDAVQVSSARKGVKLGPILEVQGSETHAIEGASAGDIVAIAKMEDLHTGTCLGEYQLPPIPFPNPMVGVAVTPKNRGDEAKLSASLHKVLEEDATLRLEHDSQTKEHVLTGMSELHLQMIRERLHRRDKLEIETHDPKIPFRETIQAPAEGSYRHKKQSGGRGQFGEVHIRMFPLPRDTKPEQFVANGRFPQMKDHHYDPANHFLWINSVVGGSIPSNFLPAVEKGFKDRMARGVIAGHQVQNVAVEVHYGKYHDVDSSEAAFKTAGSMAFRNVFQQAKPVLLEPVVKMEITVPEGNVGDLYSDMSSRGGRVLGSEAAGGNAQTVRVEVPLRSVSHYARTLSSMTGGQGSFNMEFSHYDSMPPNVQQEIISKAGVQEEEEE